MKNRFFITTGRAGAAIGKTSSEVVKLIIAKKLKAEKIDGEYHIDPEDLIKFKQYPFLYK